MTPFTVLKCQYETLTTVNNFSSTNEVKKQRVPYISQQLMSVCKRQKRSNNNMIQLADMNVILATVAFTWLHSNGCKKLGSIRWSWNLQEMSLII